jgi:hypothetical protein
MLKESHNCTEILKTKYREHVFVGNEYYKYSVLYSSKINLIQF